MAPAVIPDQVSSICNKPSQIRLLARVLADQEEGRLDPVLGQQIEQLRCPRRIGPVIECERNLPPPRGPYQRRTKKSRIGGHRAVGPPPRPQPPCCQPATPS